MWAGAYRPSLASRYSTRIWPSKQLSSGSRVEGKTIPYAIVGPNGLGSTLPTGKWMMRRADLSDALKALSKTELEKLREEVEAQLLGCLLCGNEGAELYRITNRNDPRLRATLLLCRKCFELHRLPAAIGEVSAEKTVGRPRSRLRTMIENGVERSS